MTKDRYRDWGLYHKAVAAIVMALVLSVVVRAVMAIDSAYQIQNEIVIEASTADVWPWVIENDKRPNWQGEILRVNGVSTEVGRNRLVYWKRDYKRWRSYETTTALVVERLFKSEHDSDTDRRWWQIELVPESLCRTRVVLTEIIQPTAYEDRFWFFRVKAERQQRLENSVKALKRWVERIKAPCAVEDNQPS